MKDLLENCNICPRKCNINRHKVMGYCLCDDKIIVSKVMIHKWEEPCICSEKGVGAIFFSGCNLHCIYCQNYQISMTVKGFKVSIEKLAETFLNLQSRDVSAIDLVTPTHYTYQIMKALEIVKDKIHIPIVYNCSGYESCETIDLLKDYIDIYLTDFKYFSDDTAKKFSNAEDYVETAKAALKNMVCQKKNLIFDESNMLKNGVIVRHLVLPGHRKESIDLIKYIGETYNENQIILSIMSQYTPIVPTKYKELNRRLTKFEYKSVIDTANKYNFKGFMQEKASAKDIYIPNFDDRGIL